MRVPAAPRFRRVVRDVSGAEWFSDTRVMSADRAMLAAFASRLTADGMFNPLTTTRRGVWYVVAPGRYLDALAAEETDLWAFSHVSNTYLRRVFVPNQTATADPPAVPADRLPTDSADTPHQLGEEYRRWSL